MARFACLWIQENHPKPIGFDDLGELVHHAIGAHGVDAAFTTDLEKALFAGDTRKSRQDPRVLPEGYEWYMDNRKRIHVFRHGTKWGYRWHLYIKKDRACEPCLEANRASHKDYYDRRFIEGKGRVGQNINTKGPLHYHKRRDGSIYSHAHKPPSVNGRTREMNPHGHNRDSRWHAFATDSVAGSGDDSGVGAVHDSTEPHRA